MTNSAIPGSARRLFLPLLLLLIALVLPPAALATALRGGATDLPAGLVTGLWLFKLLLAAHALAALALHRWLPLQDEGASSGTALPARWVAALLLAGLVLRLPHLNTGLWFDEIQTLVDYVRQPWGVLLTTFDSTNQHLFFSIAARAVRTVAGESAAMLRLPAVIFGVLSLWATVAFGRRWLPAREAWWSAAILAVSYHHIWFSQNARGYTGLLLGTLVSSALMIDLLNGRPATSRRVWSYAIVTALTLLTHVTALVVVAAHGLCWLLRLRTLPRGVSRWAPLAALMLAGTVTVMLYAPVIPQLLTAVSTSGTTGVGAEWQRPGWFVTEAVSGLVRGVPAGVVVIPVAGLIVLAGLIDGWRRQRLVTLMMVFAIGIMAILLLSTGHNMWPRFFFFGAAFVVQWAVHGGFVVLQRLVPQWATRVGDAGLAVVTLASLALLPRAWAPKQDYPAALAWLDANATAADKVIGTEMMDIPMNRWLGRQWPIVKDVAALHALEGAQPRTWVVTTFPIRLKSMAPDLANHLRASYDTARIIPASVGGGAILILVTPRGAAPSR